MNKTEQISQKNKQNNNNNNKAGTPTKWNQKYKTKIKTKTAAQFADGKFMPIQNTSRCSRSCGWSRVQTSVSSNQALANQLRHHDSSHGALTRATHQTFLEQNASVLLHVSLLQPSVTKNNAWLSWSIPHLQVPSSSPSAAHPQLCHRMMS